MYVGYGLLATLIIIIAIVILVIVFKKDPDEPLSAKESKFNKYERDYLRKLKREEV